MSSAAAARPRWRRPHRSATKQMLVGAAGVGLVLLVAAVVVRFVTVLAVIRAYEADFSHPAVGNSSL